MQCPYLRYGAKGGDGEAHRANQLVELLHQPNSYAPLYDVNDSIEHKIERLLK